MKIPKNTKHRPLVPKFRLIGEGTDSPDILPPQKTEESSLSLDNMSETSIEDNKKSYSNKKRIPAILEEITTQITLLGLNEDLLRIGISFLKPELRYCSQSDSRQCQMQPWNIKKGFLKKLNLAYLLLLQYRKKNENKQYIQSVQLLQKQYLRQEDFIKNYLTFYTKQNIFINEIIKNYNLIHHNHQFSSSYCFWLIQIKLNSIYEL